MFDDQKVKKSITITLAILSLLLVAKFVGEVKSFRFIGSNPQTQSVISVSGKGEVVGVPDIANFSFTVEKESLSVVDAQNKMAKVTNGIIAFLEKNNVAEEDIKTNGYNIYPRYEYEKSAMVSSYYPQPVGKQILAAYVVSQSVEVKVRNIADAGRLLSGIGELGAENVSGLSFDFDKRDEMVKKARGKAIAEARAEAAKLANALGVRLVRIISYSDGGYPIYYAKAMTAEAVGRGGGDSVVPNIPVGEDKIMSNVSITYEIK